LGIAVGPRSEPQSLRKLCIDTPTIVLAEPADPTKPEDFKVLVVFRGKNLRPGQILTPEGLTAGALRSFDELNLDTRKPRPRQISQALLFLGGGRSRRIILDGLRLCTEDGRVLAPDTTIARPFGSSERVKLVVRPRLRWQDLLARVRADVAAVDQVMAYRRLARPQRRTQALLDWVQRHRGDFAAVAMPGREDEAPAGWEDLQIAIFDWLLESARPEDAWEAVKLYAELNRGEIPRLSQPTFSTTAGRSFLAKIATNDRALLSERARALHILGERMTLWPTAEEIRKGAATTTTSKEQESLLEQFAALLPNKDEMFRTAVVRTIAHLSQPEDRALASRRTTRSLPALIAAYKSARPGPARDELATTICSMASPSEWKALTHNPPGVCAILGDLERNDATVSFFLTLRPGAPAIYEPPVLLLEKFGPLGIVTETKRLPIQVLNLERAWSLGWTGNEVLAVRQELPNLQPGSNYRLRVEGYIGKGKERQKFLSEPKRISIPALKQPSSGRPYPSRYR
jgi:hypothetical protein